MPSRNSLHRLAVILVMAVVGYSAKSYAVPPAEHDEFIEQMRANFDHWDLDRDGVLSADEIEKAVDDPTITGPAAAAAASLRRAVRAHPDINPITLDRLTGTGGDAHAAKPPAYAGMYASALTRIRDTHRDLFQAGQPHMDALRQGHLGDCFLIAVLGTVARREPERLVKMVTVSSDGQMTVEFPNGPKVTLPMPTDAEIAIGARAADDGIWPNVFEKAIGQVYLDRQKTRRHVTPYSIIGVGGSPHSPLSLLTGHACKRLGCEDFQKGKLSDAECKSRLDEIRKQLIDTQTAGRLIVGGTAPLGAGETIVPGLYYNHSYGVLNYDRNTDLVTYFNPIGGNFTPKGAPSLANGYPTSHGCFDVPLQDAVMWFGAFTLETDQPAENEL